MSDKNTTQKLEDGVIKNIEVHSSYIPALQSILLYYIDQVYPKKEDLAGILAKFKSIIEGKKKVEEVEMEWYEYHTWIFYSLLQVLAMSAKEQNLYQDTNVVYNQDILGKLTKAILDEDTDAQKSLYAEFFNDIQKQQESS